jgi:replicative DNA helicase
MSDLDFAVGPDLLPAERAILGAAITDSRGADAITDLLRPKHFWLPAHQIIFEAVTRLAEAGCPVSPVTVLTDLTRAGEMGRIGGEILPRLLSLAEPWAITEHASRVRGDFSRRQGLMLSEQIRQLALDPGFDPETGPDMARQMLETAFADSSAKGPARSGDLFDDAMRRLEDPESQAGMIQPPWTDLRDLIPVFRPGQLITVGARPGVGKSMIAGDLLRHVGLRLCLPSILFSMEMSDAEVTDRLVSAETTVPLTRIQAAEVDDRDWDRLQRARSVFAEGAFVIDDQPGITLPHIRSRLRGMARTGPARIAIVDYLQLMTSPGTAESREREIASFAAGLKRIAREFDLPLILLAQLNRASEQRHDKRPVKADLRESGAIENDSDIVILIHRPDMYEPDCPRAGEADLIVDKNRAGPTGTRTVTFQGHYGRFASMARDDWTPTSALGSSGRAA